MLVGVRLYQATSEPRLGLKRCVGRRNPWPVADVKKRKKVKKMYAEDKYDWGRRIILICTLAFLLGGLLSAGAYAYMGYALSSAGFPTLSKLETATSMMLLGKLLFSIGIAGVITGFSLILNGIVMSDNSLIKSKPNKIKKMLFGGLLMSLAGILEYGSYKVGGDIFDSVAAMYGAFAVIHLILTMGGFLLFWGIYQTVSLSVLPETAYMPQPIAGQLYQNASQPVRPQTVYTPQPMAQSQSMVTVLAEPETMPVVRICPRCGVPIEDRWSICHNCYEKLH